MTDRINLPENDRMSRQICLFWFLKPIKTQRIAIPTLRAHLSPHAPSDCNKHLIPTGAEGLSLSDYHDWHITRSNDSLKGQGPYPYQCLLYP